MKKLIVCLAVCLMTALIIKPVMAGESNVFRLNETALKKHITSLYDHIDFSKTACLSFEVFDKAYRGYINLHNAGKLSNEKHIFSICDFTQSSTNNRLWIIDLDNKKVLLNTLVAHGQGSGDEFATQFSNKEASHQSSLGFFVTGETYNGEHGTSLYLHGMDEGYNDNAYDRSIVVHGADYVSGRFIEGNNRLGRSWGCPAVPSQLSCTIINMIKDGTCLFIYYPEEKYMANAYWLNKKIERLPDFNNPLISGIDPKLLASAHPQAVRDSFMTIKYYSATGTLDSVKKIKRVM